jgi:hypothetical protein
VYPPINHLLGDFFRDPVEEKEPWWVDSKPTGAQLSLEFLTATLPDPSSRPLRYQFDGEIQAIQSAITASGYNLIDFAIPWVDEAKEHSEEFTFGRVIVVKVPNSETPMFSLKPKNDDQTHSERDPRVLLFWRQQSHSNIC